MRQIRFFLGALLTSLLVINATFLRKTVAVLLCGVMGFNPVSSYYLLNDYSKAEAAVPSSRDAVLNNAQTLQKDGQKLAACFLGICVNIPNIPNGNQPKPTASPQYSDEYQKDFDNFPHQSPITDLTGTWLNTETGTGFTINQRGCTAGYTGTLTIDGKEPPKLKFTLTQNNNQLSRADESISYSVSNSSGSYGTNFQGKISGNSIIFLANSPSISTIDKIIGTVNNTGDTITGNIYCKTGKGSATAQETFTWTKQRLQILSYQTTEGGSNLAYWKIKWQLSNLSPNGGYIVQEVSGNIQFKDNGQTKNIPYHYWEAWKVNAGSKTCSCFDQFVLNPHSDNTATGTDTLTAKARFYEGLRLPSSFVPSGNPYSGTLPSTNTNPNLPTTNATPPVVRSWSVNF